MTTLTLINRGLATATSTLPNNRRSVSDMSEEQRKAVMARLGGGGGGAARGYTGGARGGRRGPERNPTPMYVTPEGHARAVREAQIGIQSDITPFDLLASTALEAGLDGINQARMNTDNKWVDAALGVAALGLFAAGVKNARTQQALARHVSAQKTFDNVLEQMGRDADRFDSMLKGTPSSVGEDVYHTYDQLAERVTRARGYPPSAAEANRWLDKVAPKVTSPARSPTVVEDVKAFRADTLRTTGVAATDNDVATYLLKKHPESYTPPKNYIPPKSSAGDAFRSEAAKTTGSQQAQLLDYARRADMEAVAPRIVKDPWQSTKEVLSRIDLDKDITRQAQTHTPTRPSVYDFVDDEPEFYRWYEYGGKPRAKPLSDAELKTVIGNKELHMNTSLAPSLRLIKNAMRVSHGLIANARPMSDKQRKAIFAKKGGGGVRSAPAGSQTMPAKSKQSNGPTYLVTGNKITMDPTLMDDAYKGDKAAQEYDLQRSKPPQPTGLFRTQADLDKANKAMLEQWGSNMAALANERIAANSKPTTAAQRTTGGATGSERNSAHVPSAPKNFAGSGYDAQQRPIPTAPPKVITPTTKAAVSSPINGGRTPTASTSGTAGVNGVAQGSTFNQKAYEQWLFDQSPASKGNTTGTEGASGSGGGITSAELDTAVTEGRMTTMAAVTPQYTPSSELKPYSDEWRKAKIFERDNSIDENGYFMNGAVRETVRLLSNAVRIAAGVIANAGPMTDEQRKAMFAGGGGRGPARRSSSASIGRINGSTQNFNASYSGPPNQTSSTLYTRTTLTGLDQGVGLPGSERPSRTINLNRFDNLLASFEQEFPGGQSTVATRMESILSPFRENPAAIFDNPQAINQLFALIAPAVAGNTGAKNYDTKRGAMESSFYSEGLKILQAAGLMPGWSATSTSGPGGYSGVRFQNDRPTQTRYTTSRSEGDATFTRSVTTGGGGSKTPPVYYRPPNDKGVGYYNPNQPYVPGQPRINERGQPVWGPKPGEPGFIDIGKWREGANPKGPISKPTPVMKK